MFVSLSVSASEYTALLLFNEKKYEEAFKYYQRYAAEGKHTSQYYMGHYYQYGYIFQRDIKTAVTWYEKSALQGNVRSMLQLAYIHLNVEEVFDSHKVISWLSAASERGSGIATYEIYKMFDAGLISQEENAVAHKYYYALLAADQGNSEAKLFVANITLKANADKGVRMFEALRNSEERSVRRQANQMLYYIYSNDRYGKHDEEKARMFYEASKH